MLTNPNKAPTASTAQSGVTTPELKALLHWLVTPWLLQVTTVTSFHGSNVNTINGSKSAFHIFDFRPSLVVTEISAVCSTTPVISGTCTAIEPGFHSSAFASAMRSDLECGVCPVNSTNDGLGNWTVSLPGSSPKSHPFSDTLGKCEMVFGPLVITASL
jgi:hypothetical protein